MAHYKVVNNFNEMVYKHVKVSNKLFNSANKIENTGKIKSIILTSLEMNDSINKVYS